MSKVRVGIIGLGFIGTSKHLPGLASMPDEVEMVGFCDLILDRAERARDEYGSADAYVTNDWTEIIADKSLDIIHVCTWNASHREITVAALRAGKHVMCEKPMAITGADAREMVATAKETGRLLTVGYQYRWRRDNQFLRGVVDEGRLGDIYHARAHSIRRRGVPTWGVFTDKTKQGGGPLIDIGTHSLDLALWYMDNYEVASVTGTIYHKLGDRPAGNIGGPWDVSTFDVEDSAFGLITMKNGATVFLEASWALNVSRAREACVTLIGTEGGAETDAADGAFSATLNSVAGNELITSTPEFGGGYFGASGASGSGYEVLGALEAQQWIAAVVHGTDPLVRAEQACVVTEILDSIYESARTGRTIYYD